MGWREDQLEELARSKLRYDEPWRSKGRLHGQVFALQVCEWGDLSRLLVDETVQARVIEPVCRLLMVAPDFDAAAKEEFVAGFLEGVQLVMDEVPEPALTEPPA